MLGEAKVMHWERQRRCARSGKFDVLGEAEEMCWERQRCCTRRGEGGAVRQGACQTLCLVSS